MKSLATIQKLSKAGKIISKIVFICSIVGLCGCIIGILCLAFGMGDVKVGDLTIKGYIEKEAEVSFGALYAAMAAGIVLCAAEIFLAKMSCGYFENELKAGTPFTFDGAEELKRLGIYTIIVSIAAQIVAVVAAAIIENAISGTDTTVKGSAGSVSIGIAFLIMSVIFKYGAEINESKNQ